MTDHINQPEDFRITSSQPTAIRWLQKQDGTRVLQTAHPWHNMSGPGGGVEWVDVPVVVEQEEKPQL